MNTLKITFLSIVLLVSMMFALSSCQKEWGCVISYKILLCTKGADSIYVSTSVSTFLPAPDYVYSQTYSENIVSYYRQNGYTIDTVGYGGSPENIYDIATVKAYEANGVICTEGLYN